jgi:hypothetical protein
MKPWMKYTALGIVGLAIVYIAGMAYLVSTTEPCRMLSASVDSENAQVSAFWRSYLVNSNVLKPDIFCFPELGGKSAISVVSATCVASKNYPACEEILKFLTANKFDMNTPDSDGELGLTPLHEAVIGMDVDLVELLLKYGADPKKPAIGFRYKDRSSVDLIPNLKRNYPEKIEQIKQIESLLLYNRR